jgi:hypothetical protein
MKRLLAVLPMFGVACGFAAVASAATVTISGPPPIPAPYGSFVYKNSYQPLAPYTCNGKSVSISDNGSPQPRPILFKFGWFTSAPAQVGNFFKQEHGSYTISGPVDPGTGTPLPGATSVTESWIETNGSPAKATYSGWSPIAADTIINPAGQTVKGADSFYFGILSFDTPGVYTLNTAWTLDHKLYDGFGTAPAGTSNFSCEITVNP